MHDMPLYLTSMPQTIQLVGKLSMIAEQQDQPTQSLNFEVETYNFCPTRYRHNNRNINPANQRAREVVNENKCKVKN